jgi:hypothetical protein
MNQTHGLHTVVIDDRLHRVTVREACADEGGEPHDPPLAKPSRVYRDEEVPAGYWRHFVSQCIASVVLVALCCAIALFGFNLALPKPAPEAPRATAKVTT